MKRSPPQPTITTTLKNIYLNYVPDSFISFLPPYHSIFDSTITSDNIFNALVDNQEFKKICTAGAWHQKAENIYQDILNARTLLLRHYLDAPTQTGARRLKRAAATQQSPLTYQDYFNEASNPYCDADGLAAKTSPFAYLVEIYRFAMQKIDAKKSTETLLSRRPDLADLSLDPANAYTEIPLLQLANEIIENKIAQHLTLAKTDIAFIEKKLAETQYPFDLPFHRPWQQITDRLAHTPSPQGGHFSFSQLIYQIDLCFNNSNITNVLQAYTALSPAQLQLLREPESTKARADTQKKYGVEGLRLLKNSATLYAQTHLNADKLTQIFCLAPFTPKRSALLTATEALTPEQYGAVYINAGEREAMSFNNDKTSIELLSLTRSDRLSRFIRLQKWSGLAYDKLDCLIRLTAANKSAPETMLTEDSIRALGLFRYLQQTYAIDIDVFLALIGEINAYAIGEESSLLDRLLISRQPLDDKQIFNYSATDGTDAKIIQQLATAFALTEQELRLLAEQVHRIQGAQQIPVLADNTLNYSLAVISALYRLSIVSRWMNYSLPQGLLLMKHIKVQQSTLLDIMARAVPGTEAIEAIFSYIKTAEQLQHLQLPVETVHVLAVLRGEAQDTLEAPVTEKIIALARELASIDPQRSSGTQENAIITVLNKYLALTPEMLRPLLLLIGSNSATLSLLAHQAQAETPPTTKNWLTFAQWIYKLTLANLLIQQQQIDASTLTLLAQTLRQKTEWLQLANLVALQNYMKWRAERAKSDDDLRAYFDPQNPAKNKKTLLARLLEWDEQELTQAIKAQSIDTTETSTLTLLTFSQLLSVRNLLQKTKLSINTLQKIATVYDPMRFEDHQALADRVLSAVPPNAMMDDHAQEKWRDALVTYYLGQRVAQPATEGATAVSTPKDPDQLYQHLLIDNQVSHQIKTSRIAQAIASVQQYINSSLAEPRVSTSLLSHADQTYWRTILSEYALWVANIEIQIYPQNYLDPHLRSNKSRLFSALETQLNQSEINDLSVQEAILGYLNEFEQIANLKVISGYLSSESAEKADCYLIGKTRLDPAQYYWRTFRLADLNQQNNTLNPTAWCEWQKIALPLSSAVSQSIRPVFFNNRLHIAWLETDEVKEADEDNGNTLLTKQRLSIKTAYKRYDDSWSAPHTWLSETKEHLKPLKVGDTFYYQLTYQATQDINALQFTLGTLPQGVTKDPQKGIEYNDEHSTLDSSRSDLVKNNFHPYWKKNEGDESEQGNERIIFLTKEPTQHTVIEIKKGERMVLKIPVILNQVITFDKLNAVTVVVTGENFFMNGMKMVPHFKNPEFHSIVFHDNASKPKNVFIGIFLSDKGKADYQIMFDSTYNLIKIDNDHSANYAKASHQLFKDHKILQHQINFYRFFILAEKITAQTNNDAVLAALINISKVEMIENEQGETEAQFSSHVNQAAKPNSTYTQRIRIYHDDNSQPYWETVSEETDKESIGYQFKLIPNQKIYQFLIELQADGKHAEKKLRIEVNTILASGQTRLSNIYIDENYNPDFGTTEYLNFAHSGLQKSYQPIRLNTLFVEQLINRANISIDHLLNMTIQTALLEAPLSSGKRFEIEKIEILPTKNKTGVGGIIAKYILINQIKILPNGRTGSFSVRLIPINAEYYEIDSIIELELHFFEIISYFTSFERLYDEKLRWRIKKIKNDSYQILSGKIPGHFLRQDKFFIMFSGLVVLEKPIEPGDRFTNSERVSKNLTADGYQDLAGLYLIKGDSTDIDPNVKTLNQYRIKISSGQILIDYGNNDNHEKYLKVGKISNENNTNYSCKIKRYSDINHIWEVVKEETGNTALNYHFPLNPHQKIYQFQVEISDGKNSGYRQLDLQIDTVLKSAKERLSYLSLPKKSNIIQDTQRNHYIKNILANIDKSLQDPSSTSDETGSIVEQKNDPQPIDFDGANGLYFWELFFYIPWLIAQRLNAEQHYQQAEKWLWYIFDPLAIEQEISPASAYWRVRPLDNAINQVDHQIIKPCYLSDTSDPHRLALNNPRHYCKALFLAYIKNLIDQADGCYRQLTRESLERAKQLYFQALNLLGQRPKALEGNHWQTILLKDTLTPAVTPRLLQLEQQESHLITPNLTSSPQPCSTTLSAALFKLPLNKQLLNQYWDPIENRLYNLRHNLTLDGKPLYLPLFTRTLDSRSPLAWCEEQNLGSTSTQDLSSIPHYRFQFVLSHAQQGVEMLIQYGHSLLSILERQDQNGLEQLQHTQLLALSDFALTLQQQAINSAEEALANLQLSRQSAQKRYQHYKKLYEQNISALEMASLTARGAASALELTTIPVTLSAAIVKMLPRIYGAAVGGGDPAASIEAVAINATKTSQMLIQGATLSELSAGYQRRREEWQLLYQLAEKEDQQISGQIAMQKIHIESAKTQLQQVKLQQQHIQATLRWLSTRFNNSNLYQWLSGQLATLFLQVYDAVIALCLTTQAACRYEIGDDSIDLIQPEVWHDRYRGLLAGETLKLNLLHLEQLYLSRNERSMAISKTISLQTLLGDEWQTQLTALKETGEITFSLNQASFDKDYPGHYLRQIAWVSVSLPAIIGPYQDIRAILMQTANSLMIEADPSAVKQLLTPSAGVHHVKIKQDRRVNQQIALSSSLDDSGLFTLNFNDDRYLPFEGTGAISTWILTFPLHDSDEQQAMLANLTDVIIHLRYTAKDGGLTFRQEVISQLNALQ